MTKICPDEILPSSSQLSSGDLCFSSPYYVTPRRETFTIWMKSLVFNCNGCTAFNSKGEIAFRIDNYQQKCCSEVNLMDPNGHLLFTIHKQKQVPSFLGRWNIHKWSENKDSNTICREGHPWFQVRKSFKVGNRNRGEACQVSLGWDKRKRRSCFRIVEINTGESPSSSSAYYRILDGADQLVAEVKRKLSSTGVNLGDDVLSLVVEPQRDYSLVMALVTVHALINGKL